MQTFNFLLSFHLGNLFFFGGDFIKLKGDGNVCLIFYWRNFNTGNYRYKSRTFPFNCQLHSHLSAN